jgi:hypothetical protein
MLTKKVTINIVEPFSTTDSRKFNGNVIWLINHGVVETPFTKRIWNVLVFKAISNGFSANLVKHCHRSI